MTAGGSGARLRVEGLGMRFGGLRAVSDVDLDVPPGRITAIIGPNGAGKTTFFNVVSGFCRPTSGRVTLDGRDVTGLAPHRMARLGVARTFQATRLFPEASVLDNVIVGRRLHTKSNVFDALLRSGRHRREERESRERAYAALEATGTAQLAEVPVGSISQEARKRVAFALALATEPRLLLLDEPAAGINPHETDGLAELIRSIARRGVTICLVEHKMRMVMDLSDHVAVLNHGKKIAEGTPEQIRRDPVVIDAYLGAEH
ncbi:MAG TPA: ABC transporter ATP-binding protein [Longimicrobiales bacterium]|nr:ABC transporter ATP-binding protein [Longimicrobiales bacterium]